MKEIHVNLNEYFQPREYQKPVLAAFKAGYKRILLILPRRSGKEVVCWNLMIQEALTKPAVYWYIFPEYSQAKKAIWDTRMKDGRSFLDFIPKVTIDSINQQEMKIKLINGSLIQVIGASNVDRLVGANPYGIVFSEYAMTDPEVFSFLLPILRGNDGWCVINSTPRGKNHFYDLWNIAQNHPQTWFSYKMTVDDTKHISKDEIQQDIDQKLISYDLAQQEYWCSFDLGISGVVYGTNIDRMRINGQIGNVPWESNLKVNTAWDIGRDTTAIIFYQVSGQYVKIIDYYQKAGEQLEHFVNVIKSKPYVFHKHFFPHDMKVTEWAGPKFTRLFKAKQLGIDGTIVDDVSLEDGIEWTRSSLSKIWIDDKKCHELIKCLENYRYEYDERKQVYKRIPLHNWASHGADSLRYACLSLPKSFDSMTSKDVERLRKEALYGDSAGLPDVFKEPITPHYNRW